jgi:hypothetical protein
VIDYFKEKRNSSAPYAYFTPNAVLFYGKHACQYDVSTVDIIAGMSALETYLLKYQSDFDLRPSDQLSTTKFAVYLLQSGLNPFPPDPQPGVVGYANGEIMGLLPSVFKDTREKQDPNVIIHELGHGFFRIPQQISWLEEGICEFAIHYYMPTYPGIYDATMSFLFTYPYINIFGTLTKVGHKYDIGAFWAFISRYYGGPRTIGRISTSAFNANGSDVWHMIANHLKTTDGDLIEKWVTSLVQIGFWRNDTIRYQQAKQKFQKSPLNSTSMVWDRATMPMTDIIKIDTKIEKGGFQVIPLQVTSTQTFQSTGSWRYIYITHYRNGKAVVTKKNTVEIGKPVSRRYCVIIRVR